MISFISELYVAVIVVVAVIDVQGAFDELKKQGGGQASFARDYGINGGASMVSQHIKGRRPMGLKAATAYAKGFNCSLAAISPRLAKLADEVAALDKAAKGLANKESNVTAGPGIRGRIPLISEVQAGAWCVAEDLFLPGEAERWFDCPVNHSKKTFALRVSGDSMTASNGIGRSYPDGCFIFVDPEKRQPDNGDRIIACREGSNKVTFKIYKNEDGRQWLQPINTTHEPIREKFKVLGTVLGNWEDG